MILHLLKNDWQRFKRPLIVLWILQFAAALPWLLHRPNDWQVPQRSGLGWDSRLGEIPAHFLSQPWTFKVIIPAEILSTILALILASMLGAQWVKQPVTPIRLRERLTALGLSLMVFMVLPQWLLAFTNLLLHGFSPGIAALAAGAVALTAWLLLGMAAAFAAWLPSAWLSLAGWAALASAVGFISEFYRAWELMLRVYPTMPLLPVGLREWLMGALAIGFLVILFPVVRTRLNGPWRIVVAVGLILIAGLTASRLPDPDLSIVKSENFPTAAISPSVRSIQIQADSQGQIDRANRIQLSGAITSIGCPPGYAVSWTAATGGWISQNGNQVATCESVEPEGNSVSRLYYPEMAKAAMAALPNGRANSQSLNPSSNYSHNLGSYGILPSAVLSPDLDAELHLNLTGTVYRFEIDWDVPLGEETREIKAGNLTWRVRKYPADIGEPRAEVMVTHPALGISRDPDEIRWDDSRILNSLLYFHLPATGTTIRAGDRLMNSSGPLFSAAGWDRAIIAPSNLGFGKFDLTGLRLILLKPVAVARFTTTAVTRFRPWAGVEASDFALTYRYSIDSAIYRRDFFPDRPDPRTCTRDEFGRWLRVAASVYPGSSGSQYDLASFAPRFAGLMAKAGQDESVAAGLRLGTPDSKRDEVIAQIKLLGQPDRLADVALDRGWLSEARDSILRRFDQDEIWKTDAVMALEEPSTYPKLISRFLEKPERETYEKLRLLPGIEPLLGSEISKASKAFDPRSLTSRSQRMNTPYGLFLYAAKRGDSAAFGTILDLYRAIAEKRDFTPQRDLGYVLFTPELKGNPYQSIPAWLHGKSAASFRFDPLLRLWKPLP